MRSKRLGRFLVSLAPLLAGVLLTGELASAAHIDEIRQAIAGWGRRWIAEETVISRLPDHQRRLRAGLFKHSTSATWPVLAPQAPSTGLSASVDWRSFVTPVRDQGNCGSCWAFATTAALESYNLITGNLPGINDDRAEEILVSCSGAGSCAGGYIDSASNYIKGTGLPPETYFPYTASGTDDVCSRAAAGWQSVTRKISSWAYITTSTANLSAIKNALYQYGPLVTTMDVYTDFYYYSSGIYEYTTGNYEGSHAILITGYTDDASVDGGGYFVVKNSWGTGWGNQGYFYIAYSQLSRPVYFGEWTIAYKPPTVLTAPGAPSNLTAKAASASQINLAWNDNSGNEDGFKIMRCQGAGCTTFSQVGTVGAGVTSYNNTGLSTATSYSYQVRAYNSAGTSAASNTASATTASASCSYSLSPTSKSFSASGGSTTVKVTTGTGCTWTATTQASWITLTSSGGQGSGSFGYRVSRNTTGRSRSATVTAAGKTHTVSQSAR